MQKQALLDKLRSALKEREFAASLAAETVPDLPQPYRILPHAVDLKIPGFTHADIPDMRVLALLPQGCDAWFDRFVQRIEQAYGQHFLPVSRMSDGEFLFALGPQPPDIRRPRAVRHALRVMRWARRLKVGGGFLGLAGDIYVSGQYSRSEWLRARAAYAACIRELGSAGILGLDLSYARLPFQEAYFPALKTWLETHDITLTADNYVPNYFVYAALTGPRRHTLLRGRILVVNGATGEKRARIVAHLRAQGATQVHWCSISDQRSLFDVVDAGAYRGKVDIVMVGAGVGKMNVLRQLADLHVPCIDAGYVLEVWANPRLASQRAFCWPDSARDHALGNVAL